ncbi:FecR family protein [Sphingobacterium phlebotomi]|uniref:FecR family protein n=1 Tax=Sphingobacterium phlebotomi TaxID=2605433 RepID=A0A5D4H9R5_9SPHI|nr:FecR family protein [Sphingobacterium phlebotomi]TYR37344.1 FecR family protein [Sphingobacterium phlebotomi]
MDAEYLVNLISKLQKGVATAEEIRELELFYDQFDEKEGFLQYLDASQKTAYSERLFDQIYSYIEENKKLTTLKDKKRLFSWVGVAASLLLCIGVSLYFYTRTNDTNVIVQQKQTTVSKAQISLQDEPTLTLANGKKISLAEMGVGVLSDENGVLIRKTEDGTLVYDDKPGAPGEYALNLVEIPKGKRYQIHLPDGTKVWLNATSSLRYPSSFPNDKREVELVGEAYFEVAKNAEKPFTVRAAHQTIEVLGTHFNVKSYADEKSTGTALVEGSVKIVHDGRSVILKPGQQASTVDNKPNIAVTEVNMEHILAWKGGYFLFENVNIQYIMRHLARQYDIEVTYKGVIPNQRFGGAFQESATLEELLQYLESYGDIHFKREGRRVTVMK